MTSIMPIVSARDGRVVCGDACDYGFCSLVPGHVGPHAAHIEHDLTRTAIWTWRAVPLAARLQQIQDGLEHCQHWTVTHVREDVAFLLDQVRALQAMGDPLFAASVATALKEECERQHARAEQAEAQVRAQAALVTLVNENADTVGVWAARALSAEAQVRAQAQTLALSDLRECDNDREIARLTAQVAALTAQLERLRNAETF